MRGARRGVSLIEAVATIAVAIFIVALFDASFIGAKTVRVSQSASSVGLFLRDAMDNLRLQPTAALTARTNGPIAGLAYNIGRQTVAYDAAAYSGARAMLVESATTSAGPTSVALLPDLGYGDLMLKARVKVMPASPSGWRVGLLFGYTDSANYQYVSIRESALEVRKSVAGVETTTYSQSGSYAKSTWYELKAVTTGANAAVYLNGTLITTVAGSAPYGRIGFAGFGSAVFELDDVSVTSALKTGSWNFDAQSPGDFPDGFLKKAPFELTNFAASMSISNYNGATGLLDVSATATWLQDTRQKSMHYETLLYRP